MPNPALDAYSLIWPESPVLRRGAHFRVGLVVQVWNRPQYFGRMWSSLCDSELADTVIILADDASDEPETLNLLRSAVNKDVPIILMTRLKRPQDNTTRGNVNLFAAWELLRTDFDCDFLAVLDSDTLVKPDWLKRLHGAFLKLEQHHRDGLVVSGFNRPALRDYRRKCGCIRKNSLGGINMLFRSEHFERLFPHPSRQQDARGIIWDIRLAENCRDLNIPQYALVPSVVQHIGRYGLWSRGKWSAAWAPDFDYSSVVAFFIENMIRVRMLFGHLARSVRKLFTV